MRVHFTNDPNCEVCMLPENDSDRKTLERIEAECVTIGCGRHAETGKLLHARIALTRLAYKVHGEII